MLVDNFTDNYSLEGLDISVRYLPDEMAIDDTEICQGIDDVVRGLDENVTSHEFNHAHDGVFDQGRRETIRDEDELARRRTGYT